MDAGKSIFSSFYRIQRLNSARCKKSTIREEPTSPTLVDDPGMAWQESQEPFEEAGSSADDLLNLVESRTLEKRENLTSKFISALTLHGYAQFHEASGIRKVLWGLILAGMAVFIIRLTYLSYRSENYYKQVIEFESEKVEKISFPTITICSFAPMYTQQQYKKFPINVTEKEFRELYYHAVSNRRKDPKTWDNLVHKEQEVEYLKKLHEKGYTKYKQILELFEKNEEREINSHTVRKIMGRNTCCYEGRPCEFSKQFKNVYSHISQSLCKQFNPYAKDRQGLMSTGIDEEHGLMMFWDISGETYYDDSGMNGLMIEIHPYGTPHHLVDHRRTLYIEPGVTTNIDIQEIITKRLPYPFRPNCIEKVPKIVRGYPYSKVTCEVECFMQKIQDQCGCVPDQYAEYVSDTRMCNTSEMPCAFLASLEVYCHDCPSKCTATDYNIFSSRLKLSSSWVYESLKDTDEWRNKPRSEIMAYVNENIVGFRIGFRSLEKQMRTYKEATPWYERISMLGGIMGLLLGVSVITAFEFIFFVFDYVYITVKYRCTREYLSAVIQDNYVTSKQLKTALQRRVERLPRDNCEV